MDDILKTGNRREILSWLATKPVLSWDQKMSILEAGDFEMVPYVLVQAKGLFEEPWHGKNAISRFMNGARVRTLLKSVLSGRDQTMLSLFVGCPFVPLCEDEIVSFVSNQRWQTRYAIAGRTDIELSKKVVALFIQDGDQSSLDLLSAHPRLVLDIGLAQEAMDASDSQQTKERWQGKISQMEALQLKGKFISQESNPSARKGL